MVASLRDVIDEIDRIDAPEGRTRPLPDDALIERYERAIGVDFPDDYRLFLKTVSNAFVGYLSPFTLYDESVDDYDDLRVGVDQARKLGVPADWLPICEDNGDYYCMAPDGTVRFWDHHGSSDESWPDLATWAKQVWLDGD